MCKSKIYILLLFLCSTFQIQAQIWTYLHENTKICTGNDLSETVFSCNTQLYKNTALISAGVLGISLFDKATRSFARANHSNFNNTLFSIDDYYGEKWYTAGGIAAVYFGGLLSGQDEIRETGLLAAEAWFYTGLTAVFVKELFGRSRPYRDKGPYDFHPFRFNEPQRSFFSGHASTVFAVSTVMASRMDNIFWKCAWYAAALLTSGARMYHDQHWLSDVAAGAVFGYAVGRFVVNRTQKQTDSKIQFSTGNSDTAARMIGITIFLD